MTGQDGRHRPIPLTIVGGFLGAGKTTLLNHVITNAGGRRFAVVVNDFGAINIDARLIVSVEGETIALTNGCVCCVVRDDLVKAVMQLCAAPEPPDHIVIETSGVSRPLSVVESFLHPEVARLVEVQTIIALLDADQVLAEAATYADVAYAQIAVADLVVINKTDLVPPARLVELRERVERIVPRARILETRFGAIPVAMLFDHDVSAAAGEAAQRRGPGADHGPRVHGLGSHGHGAEFASWLYRDDDRRYSFNAVQRLVEGLPRGIYRAKGIVRLDLPTGEDGVLQVTGRRGWLRLIPAPPPGAPPPPTEIVFIGAPDAATDETLGGLVEESWRLSKDHLRTPHIVTDLRAFRVEFV